jgi:hypothetical protein
MIKALSISVSYALWEPIFYNICKTWVLPNSPPKFCSRQQLNLPLSLRAQDYCYQSTAKQ